MKQPGNIDTEDERKNTMMRSAQEHDGQMYVDMKRGCRSALYHAGMRAVGHWANPGNDTVYALARVKFDLFLEEPAKNREYSRRDHEYFAKNADRVFDKVVGKCAKGYVDNDWPSRSSK